MVSLGIPSKQNYIGQIAEAKMGKLLSNIPRAKLKRQIVDGDTGVTIKTKLQKTGIGKMERSRAQILNDNRDVIEEVINEDTSKMN